MSEMSEVTTDTRATIAVSSQGESWGDIVLKFYPDVAPNHAKNFCKLAGEEFLQWDHVSSSHPRIHDPRRRPEQQESPIAPITGWADPGITSRPSSTTNRTNAACSRWLGLRTPTARGRSSSSASPMHRSWMVNTRPSEKSSAAWKSRTAWSTPNATAATIPSTA